MFTLYNVNVYLSSEIFGIVCIHDIFFREKHMTLRVLDILKEKGKTKCIFSSG